MTILWMPILCNNLLTPSFWHQPAQISFLQPEYYIMRMQWNLTKVLDIKLENLANSSNIRLAVVSWRAVYINPWSRRRIHSLLSSRREKSLDRNILRNTTAILHTISTFKNRTVGKCIGDRVNLHFLLNMKL